MAIKNDAGPLRDAHLGWTEAEFQRAVIALAKSRGWMVHHTRPARTARGWRTPVEGDAGFPDLVLARGGTVWIVELKAEQGTWTKEQQAWARELGATWKLYRPRHWPEIERLLE